MEKINVSKLEILQSLTIMKSHGGDESRRFYSSAALNIDGYKLELENEYYPTIDEAVMGIKERICEAVLKFEPVMENRLVNQKIGVK